MRCAVVGAGIGGVTAAVALARKGFTVEVFEKAEALGEVGAGLQLAPNAVKVLRALELDELEEIAELPEAVEMRGDRRGQRIATIPLNPEMEARFGAPYWQFHRADLLAALVRAAEASGVTFRLGQSVQRPPEADLVVGADGIRSGLREFVVGPSEPRFMGQVAWRGLLEDADLPEAWRGRTQLCLGPGRHIVMYRLRGGTLLNVVAVQERSDWQAEDWSTKGDPGEMRDAFSDTCPEIRAVLARIDETYLWGLFGHLPLPLWHREQVVLLGDACHPMLPFMAQGASMAIEDAYVLAEAVAESGVPQGLVHYQDLRHPRASRVQAAATANAGVYHMRRSLKRQGLHMAIRMRAALPGGLLTRLAWLYGGDVTDPRHLASAED